MGSTTLDTLLQTGLSLPALDYFKLAETSGTTAANEIGGRNAGSYVNTPTLGATGDIFGEASGGYAATLNGTDEYVDLGTSSREWASQIGVNGLTIIGCFKQLSTPASLDRTLIGVSGNNGFKFILHRDALRYKLRIEFTDNAGGVTFRNLQLSHADGDSQPYRLTFTWFCLAFNKTGNVCKVWLDGHELTFLDTQGNAATGTFSNSAQSPYVGALNTSGSPAANSYVNCTIQRIAAYAGVLTDADRIAIMRAATVTDATGKLYGIVNEWSGTNAVKFRDGSDVQVAVGSGVYAWDATRAGMVQAVQTTGANQPTYQSSPIGTELDFDNTYQNRSPSRRHAMSVTLTNTIHSQWMTIAAVCRPAVSTLLGVNTQAIIGFRYSGATWIGLALDSATSKWGVWRNGTMYVPADPFPRARTLPGLSCAAIVSGYNQSTLTAGIFSDGTFGQTASTMATGVYYAQYGTDFLIGGDASTYGDLFSGRVRNVVIARCPIQPSALAEWESSTRANAGYPSSPTTHIHIAHDSIGSMNAATANMGYQAYLPASASYTNSSRDGDKQAEQITTLTAFGSNIFPSSATTKIGLIAVGRNDVQTGTPTLGTMQTQYASIRTLLINAGANRIVAVKVNPSDLGSIGAAWNSYLDTVVGLGLADQVVTLPSMTNANGLTVADNIHPNDAGMYQMYLAIWGKLSSYFGGVVQGIRAGRKRAVMASRRRRSEA
jgi:hypothetical protein